MEQNNESSMEELTNDLPIINNVTITSRLNLQTVNNKLESLRQQITKVIIGKIEAVDLILIAILSDGHILLEGMPGVAKTRIAKSTAKLLDVDFSRIQFTPDLMPSDVLGTNIFNPAQTKFEFHQGPIFSNIVLIDEINRAPAKTQAALFEVMEEHQITIDGIQYKLEAPFIILATQNPVEQEGTYRLPEAQLDRFLFKLKIDYPEIEEEIAILNLHNTKSTQIQDADLSPIWSKSDISQLKELIQNIHISQEILQYIATIVHKTRQHPAIYLGASPRASLALLKSAKAYAALQGRDFVLPEDIIYLAYPVLRHRIILTPEKEMEGFMNDDIIKELLDTIPVPR